MVIYKFNMDSLKNTTHFIWDENNLNKNWLSHQVRFAECEEIFFNQPLIILDDIKHSQRESRWYALGHTNAGKRLFVVFTIRGNGIRIISARSMNKKERKAYEKEIKKNTQI